MNGPSPILLRRRMTSTGDPCLRVSEGVENRDRLTGPIAGRVAEFRRENLVSVASVVDRLTGYLGE
jgi:hypothetical protein